MGFLLRILVIAAVSFGLAHVLPGVHIDSFWTAIVFAVVLAILNLFIKPLIILFTLPFTILTLGLFLFIVNAIVVLLASKFVHGIRIDGLLTAILFSLILSVVSSVLGRVLARDRRRRLL